MGIPHLDDVRRRGTGKDAVHHAAGADVVEADREPAKREPMRDVPPHGTGEVVAADGRVQQAVLQKSGES